MCKKIQKPLVIDADGLYLLTQDISLIQDYQNVILTPNAIEFWRLFGDTNNKLQTCADKVGRHVTILEKAKNDRIYDTVQMQRIECPPGGSNRRCGGQGDILAGVLAIFYHWALETIEDDSPAVIACVAASYFTKYCNKLAYESLGRSMMAGDMIEKIHKAFNETFENDNSKVNYFNHSEWKQKD
jgi:ATP-dependent NAD(P)H-hydrate dehydratase